ncbi:hypothetical protein COO60DRAFT_1485513 [Scenedesmus sp. NREL 46B-D3]|nr:hypothetical protein COO60DRAFT_1485513 [Scenedesmus sp. NREL 46B-D3]
MKHVYVMLIQSTYVLVGSLSLFVPAAPLQALHPAQITAAIRDCSTAEQLVAGTDTTACWRHERHQPGSSHHSAVTAALQVASTVCSLLGAVLAAGDT